MERDPGKDPAPRARRGGRRRRRRRRQDIRARTVRSALQPPPAGAHGAGAQGAGGARGPRWRWGWRRWGPQWWRPRGRGGPADNRLQAGGCAALALLPGALCAPLRRVANAHFALVALLSLVPAVSAFPPGPALAPALFLGAAAAARGLCTALRRHHAARAADRRRCQVFSGEQKRFVSRCWQDLRVGDFVRLGRDEMVPADILLLASSAPGGLCHVDTASLDGETSLRRRQVVRGLSEPVSAFDPLTFTSVIECERPNNDLSRFRGCITHSDGRKAGLHRENLLLRGCTVRNTEAVVGIVVYAGLETKALLNRSGPRHKRSKLERQMDRDVLWCVLLLVGLCLVSAVGHGAWVRRHQEEALFWVPEADGSSPAPATAAAYAFLTMVVLLQVLVPVSLYVSLEVVRLCQAHLLQQDAGLYDAGADARPRCRALHLAEDLGQVRHVFSDKTGTLTENRLALRRCSVAGCEYAHARRLARCQEADSDSEAPGPRGGSLSQRGSIGSHRNARPLHRTHSSPMEEDIRPDPELLEKLSDCGRRLALARHQPRPLAHLPPELADVFDFFIALALCNTVVVSAPDRPRPRVRVPCEPLGSPVKTLEAFLRRFSPGRLRLGLPAAPKATSKATSEATSEALAVLPAADSSLLGPEEQPSPPARAPATAPEPRAPELEEEPEEEPEPEEPEPEEQPEPRYEAESPDEAALVRVARAYGCALEGRWREPDGGGDPGDRVALRLPRLGRLAVPLLHTLAFDAARRRMSVVVRHPLSRQLTLYTKGADSALLGLLRPCEPDDASGRHQKRILSKTQRHLRLYALEGLRTLCIAKRVLSQEEYACWLQGHLEAEAALENREELLSQSAVRLETNLHLLGATGIEDRLQEGVPETIAALRQAGLQIWVLTGDKQETAVSIAYACRLLDPAEELLTLHAGSQEACAALLDQCLARVQARAPRGPPEKPPAGAPSLVIDGHSLAHALEEGLEDRFLLLAGRCRAVLCCRTTPLQKSRVVRLVRSKLKALTLAVGDGANDVSMIQTADVGVGVWGEEGMQAVMASDFAIARFRHLQRLLIVHGHWCYSRLANMALYFFYKNTMFVGLLFWFQFFCGFSASAMIDQWYLVLFNLLFSSLPQLVTGVLDRDVPAHTLLAQPQLYRSGQDMEEYGPRTFWWNMADAAFQSLVCFFIPYLAYYDSDVDLFTWGTPVTAIALLTFLLHLGIETKTWTWLNWAACGLSVLLFFTVAFAYNASCTTCFPPSNPYWTMQTLAGDPRFYLTCLLAPVTALLPRLFFRALQGTLCPTPLQRARQLALGPPGKHPAPAGSRGPLPGAPSPGTSEPSGLGASASSSAAQDDSSPPGSRHRPPPGPPEASEEPRPVDVDMGVGPDVDADMLLRDTSGHWAPNSLPETSEEPRPVDVDVGVGLDVDMGVPLREASGHRAPDGSPEASEEPQPVDVGLDVDMGVDVGVDVSLPLRDDSGCRASDGSSRAPDRCSSDSTGKPAHRPSRAASLSASLSSAFGLPALRPLGWISSLSLVGGRPGGVWPLPRNGLHADKPAAATERLPGPPSPARTPDGDLGGLGPPAADCC